MGNSVRILSLYSLGLVQSGISLPTFEEGLSALLKGRQTYAPEYQLIQYEKGDALHPSFLY